MVPTTLNITIDQALKESPTLQQAYESEPQVKELIDTALKLEGLVRNSGVHAAGVVISPQPLTELVPLHKTKNDEIVTAYDMKAVERSEEHTSELQSRQYLVCRLLLEKKNE